MRVYYSLVLKAATRNRNRNWSPVVHGIEPRNWSTESVHKRPYGTALGTGPRWNPAQGTLLSTPL